MNQIYSDEFPLYKETYVLTGIAMEVYRILGKGFAEIFYKDALDHELTEREIPFKREQEFTIKYKDIILPHKFYADFVIDSTIILEVKCRSKIMREHMAQVLNYLPVTGLQVGLILNFSENSLEHRRVIRIE